MKISRDPVGTTEAERLANSYLGAMRSHQYSTVDGYVSYCPEALQDEVEMLIGQRMRHVLACIKMANSFRQSESEDDVALVKVLDEPLRLLVTAEEFETIMAKLPVEAVEGRAQAPALKLINGSIIVIEQ